MDVGLSQSTIRARWRSSGVRRRRHIRQAGLRASKLDAAYVQSRDRRRWTTFIRVRSGFAYCREAAALKALYVVLSLQSANMMPAIFRARATTAMNLPRRSAM